jgi:hypothetical protein
LRKALLAVVALLMFCGLGATAATPNPCKEPTPGSDAAPLVSPPVIYRVIGAGRLPFYSAPNLHCVTPGVFVVPKDELIVYALTPDGWASVMYVGGDMPIGWVRSARLKSTGFTMGPKQ